MKQSYRSDIRLGERYRDSQTGIEGVATAVFFFQHGCERVNIELINGDGELKEFSFDAPRLVHVDTEVRVTSTRTGGPARGQTRRPGVDAARSAVR